MSTLDAPPRSYATRGGAALAAEPVRRPGPRPAERPATAPNPRHLRVVAPAERVRRRLTPATGVLLTALLFITLFAIAIAHALLVQGQIRLDGLDSKLTVEQARYQRLRTEVAEMESPARVVAAAQGLGMVSPQDLVYLQPEAIDATPADMGGPPSSGAGVGAAVLGGDEPAAAGTANEWAVMKPLLESPAP